MCSALPGTSQVRGGFGATPQLICISPLIVIVLFLINEL